jgi:glycosyltransferase involved in cell wall biosynthesis
MAETDKRISVVINTYNAELHLERVLEAVKDFDEVLVCDMESTDRTMEIARRHGCRIVTFPKANHVSAEPARTFAIQSAACPWVLVVDADELVTPELRDFLYRRIGEPGCPAGFYIPRLNKFMGRYTRSIAYDHQLRFFKRDGTEWSPYVHTFPKVDGPTERISANKRNVRLIHLADESISDLVRKTNSYTDGELQKRPDRHYGVLALFWRPAWRFLRNYFLKLGILDGRAGLVRAGMDALYQYVLVAKVIEKELTQKNKQE